MDEMKFRKNRYKYAVLVLVKKYEETLQEYIQDSINIPTKDLRTSLTYAKKLLDCFKLQLTQDQLKRAVNIPAREFEGKYKKMQKKETINEKDISETDYKYLPHISYYICFVDEKKESCKLSPEQLTYTKQMISWYMRFQNMWESTVIPS
jgi:hypothetical protein